jgi:hypothetical protein
VICCGWCRLERDGAIHEAMREDMLRAGATRRPDESSPSFEDVIRLIEDTGREMLR